MESFFLSTKWTVMSALISIVGLVGAIAGFHQYFKSSKELREYKYLFKVAGQHIDLEDKKSQIDNYEKQIAVMQETIKEKIPKEAQKIALKGILDNELQALSASYTKVRTLQSELELLMPDEFPNNADLIKKVNKIIEPSYSHKRFNNLFSTLFYLVSIISSFLSMILPYSMYKMMSQIILLFQLVVGVRLTISVIRINYTKKELANIGSKICLTIPPIFMGLSLIILYCADRFDFTSTDVTLGMSLAFFTTHVVFGIMHFYPKNKKCRNAKLFIFWAFLSAVCVGTMTAFVFSSANVFGAISICTAIINEIFWSIYFLGYIWGLFEL